MASDQAQILLIEGDSEVRRFAQEVLARRGHTVHAIDRLPADLAALTPAPDVVLLARRPDIDSTGDIQTIQSALPHSPVIILTPDGSVEAVERAMHEGSLDVLSKPLDEGRLVLGVAKAIEHRELLQCVHEYQSDSTEVGFEGMIGQDPQMLTLFRVIQNVAPTDASVLIQGESGTGKELVARAIHRRSSRRGGNFVALNMGALPKEMVESTLFGHERGSFSGAERRRTGVVEEASGGTLFLDEIGEMPLDLQAKMLRFLQERAFRRVGGESDIRADVRIISATNHNALADVQNGTLRADLYYRLNVVPIQIPALRHRRGDVKLIANYALKMFSQQHSKQFEAFEDRVMARLMAMPWPGNVRQLLAAVERMVVLNSGRMVTEAMLPLDLDEQQTGLPGPHELRRPPVDRPQAPLPLPAPMPASASQDRPVPFRTSRVIPMPDLERQAIVHALEVYGNSARAAAEALQISEATIYRKIKSYGMRPPKRRR